MKIIMALVVGTLLVGCGGFKVTGVSYNKEASRFEEDGENHSSSIVTDGTGDESLPTVTSSFKSAINRNYSCINPNAYCSIPSMQDTRCVVKDWYAGITLEPLQNCSGPRISGFAGHPDKNSALCKKDAELLFSDLEPSRGYEGSRISGSCAGDKLEVSVNAVKKGNPSQFQFKQKTVMPFVRCQAYASAFSKIGFDYQMSEGKSVEVGCAYNSANYDQGFLTITIK